MLVVLVVSEIRKAIACLIVLRTKQCSNWFLFEPFKCDMAGFFSTCDLQLWKRTLYHFSYCDQSTSGELIGSATYSRALWSPAGKGLTTWLSFVMLNCVFVTYPCGILGQMWYLILSIPDLCPFYYIVPINMHCPVFFL